MRHSNPSPLSLPRVSALGCSAEKGRRPLLVGGRLSERRSQQKRLLRRAGRCASVISLLSLLPAWTSASPRLSHVSLSAVAGSRSGGTLEAGLSQSLPAHRPQPVLLQSGARYVTRGQPGPCSLGQPPWTPRCYHLAVWVLPSREEPGLAQSSLYPAACGWSWPLRSRAVCEDAGTRTHSAGGNPAGYLACL